MIMQISSAKIRLTALLTAAVLLLAIASCGQETGGSSSGQVQGGTVSTVSKTDQPANTAKNGIVDIFAAGDNILHQAVIDSARNSDGIFYYI